jgi:hypothetical protein
MSQDRKQANDGKIPATMVERLDQLCYACPKGDNARKCPFGIFSGLSRPARLSLFSDLTMDRAAVLFDMAADCSCPADLLTPKKEAP